MTLPQIVHDLYQELLHLFFWDFIVTMVVMPVLWIIYRLVATCRKKSVSQDFCPEFTPEVVSAPPPTANPAVPPPIRGQTAEVEAFLREMVFFHDDIIRTERFVASLATLSPRSSTKEGNDNTPYYEN
jgi:hypothetical protein